MREDASFQTFQMNDVNEWGSFYAFKTLVQITGFTASRTLQGDDVRSRLDKSFADRYYDFDSGFTPLNFLFTNLPLESKGKRDTAQQEISDFFVDILKKRRAEDSSVRQFPCTL